MKLSEKQSIERALAHHLRDNRIHWWMYNAAYKPTPWLVNDHRFNDDGIRGLVIGLALADASSRRLQETVTD